MFLKKKGTAIIPNTFFSSVEIDIKMFYEYLKS